MTDSIESLWPSRAIEQLSDRELADIYAYPESTGASDCWIRANFVSSLDGAASAQGRSEPLSSPADKRVFRLLRALSDVILVGAGTVRVEGYGSTHLDIAGYADLRRAKNPVPPVAVVTQSADIDPSSVLFTESIVAPIILTSRAAPPERLAALEAAGADLAFTSDREVSIGNAVEELRRRGLRRALCEGGPHLFTSLLAADRIDDLCLTLSPTLVVGPAERICAGSSPFEAPREMRLASVLSSHGSLLLRYTRR